MPDLESTMNAMAEGAHWEEFNHFLDSIRRDGDLLEPRVANFNREDITKEYSTEELQAVQKKANQAIGDAECLIPHWLTWVEDELRTRSENN
jgi:hypothetical protein